MTMLDRLLSLKTAKASKDKAGQGSPRHIEVHRRPSSEVAPQAFNSSARTSDGELQGQAPVHRWQSWDYSDSLYEVDRHPLCKSHSRKLSDLGAKQPVELVAAHAPTAASAAAHHHKQAPQKAVLSPCLSVLQDTEEGSDTAAMAEQAVQQDQQ